MKSLTRSVLLLAVASFAQAAPYESRVRAIDRQVLAIDRESAASSPTRAESCSETHTCTITLSYWDTRGRLQKTVDKSLSDINPSMYISRYYSDCRLIFTRTAPSDHEAVKHPNLISKYYFHNGKLLRVVAGDAIQPYSEEQMKDTEHLQAFQPAACTQK